MAEPIAVKLGGQDRAPQAGSGCRLTLDAEHCHLFDAREQALPRLAIQAQAQAETV
ncbi:hypothetical protein JOS77_11985 [Chromobacterium haemolyticum]|nr:hypothetical protein JOS77_11985 [Chromobacterium haemolyticum]